MRRVIPFVIAALLFSAAAAEGDSMAHFRALLEHSRPSAADYGGMVAPEIFSVAHYPAYPQPGDRVTVRAKVASYSSMVPYEIAKVTLTYRKNRGGWNTKNMKLEDPEHGIYSLTFPQVREGDEIFYAVRALDDWGNVAVELPPGSPAQTLMRDSEDFFLHPPLDIREITAAYGDGLLRLCMEQNGEFRKTINGEMAVYGIALIGRDVRYKPDETESELGSALVATYLPGLNVKDIVRTYELLDAAGGKKGKSRAEFTKEEKKFCFTFAPEIIREEYSTGLKLSGVTITGDLATMTLKPKDTTRVVMLYLGDHSFKVYSIK